MASEDVINTADIFLREVPNVKISNGPKIAPFKPQVKEEMQTIRLSRKSEELIMETLTQIHGDDFTLKDVSSYIDSGANLGGKYWKGRGNLVIKGCCDYSNTEKEPENDIDRFKMFAVMRLESYGFHKEHCQEALEYCTEVEDALCLLYEKYLKLKPTSSENYININCLENELMEQRNDERAVLESIYDDAFSVKILDSVWIITNRLDYLIKTYCNNKVESKRGMVNKTSRKQKEKCRNIQRGQVCKYGNNCRFSHDEDPKPDNTNDHLNDYTFELEIRFPPNTKYPYEPPIVFLKSNAVLPELLCLHICKRLQQEAQVFSADGIPSVYSIVELLRNEDEMCNYLKGSRVNFIGPSEKLFPKQREVDLNRINRPTHYRKGVTNRDNKRVLTEAEILSEDRRIAEQFAAKLGNPKYKKMIESRSNLPAWTFKSNILNALRDSQIIVVSGETGCGKSTQVPQFILDDWLTNCRDDDQQKHLEIVCTQPRRISAIGVAERVADERVEKIGGVVGYQIRLESKLSAATRLTFCTTGILLRRLEVDSMLKSVSHIIVDEVHERSEESDFLLLILRDLLALRKDLKVILMSATLNAGVFSDYFGEIPVLDIPGRTFPVTQVFLEDFFEQSGYVVEENSQYARSVKLRSYDNDNSSFDVTGTTAVRPKDVVRDENLKLQETVGRYKDYNMKTCKNLFLMDPERVNLDLIEGVLTWITSGDHEYTRSGSILVFLPGIAEITALHDHLIYHPEFNPKYGKYVIIPLHSSLTSAEQSAVFEKPKRAEIRKIILSTNIAETSITIDDCTYVVDSGKMKEKHFDSSRNMESLDTVWVTRANALQRKGRAGRVMSGICVHLYTHHRFKHHFLAQPIPEIQRIPLEQLLLKIKVLPSFASSDLHDVLNKTIEPPVKDSIDSSIARLHNVGALDRENSLTPLGHHLAALPVDVRIGKLMLFGAIFSCIDSVLTMAACLSYKSPFVTPFGKKDAANAKRKKFSMGFSDQMTILCAYNKYQEVNRKSYVAGNNFARENYLSHNTLVTIADIKHQFLELLVSIGFVPIDIVKRGRSGQDNVYNLTGAELNVNGSNMRLLSSILCTALYPNVAKILTPEKSFVASAAGAVPKQIEAKELRFRTKHEQVFLHPSSVIHDVKHFPSPFLVYQEKIKTSKIFIRDCCMIPVMPLVLFSGYDVNITVNKGATFLVLDDDKWIMFEAEEHKVAEMVRMIRMDFLELLEEKIRDPLLNMQHHEKGERIITTILHLVSNE